MLLVQWPIGVLVVTALLLWAVISMLRHRRAAFVHPLTAECLLKAQAREPTLPQLTQISNVRAAAADAPTRRMRTAAWMQAVMVS